MPIAYGLMLMAWCLWVGLVACGLTSLAQLWMWSSTK